MKIIDLFVVIENDVFVDLLGFGLCIFYMNYVEGVVEVFGFFLGLDIGDVFGVEGWVVEYLNFMVYVGIYFDVFWYFVFMMNNGECVWMIDEVLFDWCIRLGVKFDLCYFFDVYVVIVVDF